MLYHTFIFFFKTFLDVQATFVIDYGFGGAAVWSLDQDDFNGDVCDQGPYPLVSQLYDYLEAGKYTVVQIGCLQYRVLLLSTDKVTTG